MMINILTNMTIEEERWLTAAAWCLLQRGWTVTLWTVGDVPSMRGTYCSADRKYSDSCEWPITNILELERRLILTNTPESWADAATHNAKICIDATRERMRASDARMAAAQVEEQEGGA